MSESEIFLAKCSLVRLRVGLSGLSFFVDVVSHVSSAQTLLVRLEDFLPSSSLHSLRATEKERPILHFFLFRLCLQRGEGEMMQFPFRKKKRQKQSIEGQQARKKVESASLLPRE